MSDRLLGDVDLNRLDRPDAAAAYLPILQWQGRAVAHAQGACCALIGRPRFDGVEAQQVARQESAAAAVLLLWRKDGPSFLGSMAGSYALVVADSQSGSVFLAVDRFATQPICYTQRDGRIGFADRADCVQAADLRLDPQSIFEYLFFHVIPAPRTVFQQVSRLPAGHCLHVQKGRQTLSRHAPLVFPVAAHPKFADMRHRLFQHLEDSVRDAMAERQVAGAFLSGGTDSSTVVGMMGRVSGRSVKAYSIGFEAAGYDEMAYARLAARHFGAEHHEYYVTPKDLLSSIPAVARHHDQPFGNSSALPAYYCAKMAREDGCDLLLAGDGGDELFGGNSRYAMQVFLDGYRHVPEPFKRLIEPLCAEASPLRRIPGLRQATGYVRHARVPMPKRMQGMNLLMELDPYRVFHEDFHGLLSMVTPQAHMDATWRACEDPSIVNRMLAYDWQYTLADSDLPKVRGAVDMAGVGVSFPLLDDRLVEFSMTLPQHWKLNRFRLRWFFKEALRGFLPDEIIKKKKHGFGLPHGQWIAADPALQGCARDALQGLVKRRILRGAFVDDLLDRLLPIHPGYYGEMVWILIMLEHWLRGQPESSL